MLRLKAIRRRKGISADKLSEMSGICRATISKIENDHGDVSTKTLKALADALGVKVTDFFVE